MSINIIVGSDEEDVAKIKNTSTILHFVNKLISNDNAVLAFNEVDITKSDIDELIDWYASMLEILTNPSFATESV